MKSRITITLAVLLLTIACSAAPAAAFVRGTVVDSQGSAYTFAVGTANGVQQQLLNGRPVSLCQSNESAARIVAKNHPQVATMYVVTEGPPSMLGVASFSQEGPESCAADPATVPGVQRVAGGTVVIDNPPFTNPFATEDSVVGAGDDFGGFPGQTWSFDVRSSPTGETPVGAAGYTESFRFGYRVIRGAATCLRVRGFEATIGIDIDPTESFEWFGAQDPQPIDGYTSFSVVGNGGVTSVPTISPTPVPCPPPELAGGFVLGFDFAGEFAGIIVVDARPRSLTKPCVEQRGTIRFTNPQCKRLIP